MSYWLAPVALWAAAAILRAGRLSELITLALGILVAWSGPAVDLLQFGDLTTPLIGGWTVLGLALFGRWHEQPTVLGWLGLAMVMILGWSVHPQLWFGFNTIALGGWAVVARRHGWRWHLGLMIAFVGSLAVSFPAWADWLRDWWVWLPLQRTTTALPLWELCDSWVTIVRAEARPERLAYVLLFLAGAAGGVRRRSCGRRCPSAGSAVGAAVALGLAAVGIARQGSIPLTPARLVVLSLWLAVLPAALGMSRLIRWTTNRQASRSVAYLALVALVFLTAAITAVQPSSWDLPAWGPRPFTFGLPAQAVALGDTIQRISTPDARVLWEDLAGRMDIGWTVLMPRRLSRPFLGGVDLDGVMEHAACALRDGTLAGRAVATWTDAELDAYARRYNIGCVVCTTAESRRRFARWSAAQSVVLPDAAGSWSIFTLRRPHSYILKGHARQLEINGTRVTMGEVVPDGGEVVLSLHYQERWNVRPAEVQIERELDPYDPIPFIRIRTNGPVGRITLTWDRP
jgi:hypothetical protein